ncbi:hypothetical protein DL765_001066 [Monosporascus sp. GIB2]|nr:hypothetical protein DL765_001066 [Monosporascus sp. GIB2]
MRFTPGSGSPSYFPSYFRSSSRANVAYFPFPDGRRPSSYAPACAYARARAGTPPSHPAQAAYVLSPKPHLRGLPSTHPLTTSLWQRAVAYFLPSPSRPSSRAISSAVAGAPDRPARPNSCSIVDIPIRP